MNKNTKEKLVLVAVLKKQYDLNILLTEKWYRIPVANCPRLRFEYIAFYQPAGFGADGKRIRYYAKISNYKIYKRKNLLPNEPNHPRADEYYLKFFITNIRQLASPIRNIIPRRISFGFTTLKQLKRAKNILQLYGVAPTEQIIEKNLKLAGIKAKPQHYVCSDKKCYRLDLTIFCKNGNIAIECDNKKAHSGKAQKEKDKQKSAFLRQHNWRVIRLTENEIISNLPACLQKILSAISFLNQIN